MGHVIAVQRINPPENCWATERSNTNNDGQIIHINLTNKRENPEQAHVCLLMEGTETREFPKAEDDTALAEKEPAACCLELCPITTLYCKTHNTAGEISRVQTNPSSSKELLRP